MSRLDFANYFVSNQRLHALSWINRTSLGNGLFWWFFLLLIFFLAFSFSVFVWREANKSPTHRFFFGWQLKGEDHFRSWFPFLLFVHLVAILYCSDIVRSKDLSAHFFYFVLILDQEFSFLPFFLLSPILWLGIFFLFFLLSPTFWLGISFPFFAFSLIGNFHSFLNI